MNEPRRYRKTPPAVGWVRSTELCRRLEITYRQLDHWVTMGYVTPTLNAKGTGNSRWWSPDDVDLAERFAERVEDCPFPHTGGGGRR